VLNISIIKKGIIHLRSSIRIVILISIACFIIIGILAFFYKPAYMVTYNGDFIGYSDSKSKLQEKINDFIENGDGNSSNIAYVQITSMPKYELTFLKRNISTNDDDIYKAITSTGVTYYNYFAIQLNGEDKYFVSTYSEAEDVVNKLKEKNSNNIDNIKIMEKYNTELASFTNTDECVSALYEEKKSVKPAYTGTNNSSTYIASLGISFVEPVQGMLTSGFGVRRRDNHKGLDIANSMGTPIRAAAAGTVTYAQYNSGGYGNLVIISHGNGVQTYYGHCSKLYVTQGQTVSQGEVISAMGSTGISTGSHLHWEVRINGVAQNPRNYLYK
jgi:murein DD-endopeptidase MepM/ murein hydrolase activator NlpD